MTTEATSTLETQPTGELATSTRRGTLAALLAGSALGLAAMSGASQAEAAKGKKGKKGKKSKDGNGKDGNGKNGNGKNGNGKNAGDALPSVRMVETTTVFDGDGVFDAISKCPDGYVPINGGFFSSVPAPVLLTSTPRLDENAWLIEIDGAETGHEITVTAICLAATVVVDEVADSKNGKRGRKNKKK